MKLPDSMTTVTPLSKTVALILFVLLPFFGFYFGMSYGAVSINTQTPNEVKTAVPVTQIEEDKNNDQLRNYRAIELSLLNEKYNPDIPTSLAFGISLPPFHPEWKCADMGYGTDGSEFSCQQVPCAFQQNQAWPPRRLNDSEQKQCQEELNSREFPQSLHSITLRSKETIINNGADSDSYFSQNSDVRQTSKGRKYIFKKERTDKYTFNYSASFISTFELDARLQNDGLEYRNPDRVYAEYTLSTKIDDDIEPLVQKLFEDIIDTIEFKKPQVK